MDERRQLIRDMRKIFNKIDKDKGERWVFMGKAHRLSSVLFAEGKLNKGYKAGLVYLECKMMDNNEEKNPSLEKIKELMRCVSY